MVQTKILEGIARESVDMLTGDAAQRASGRSRIGDALDVATIGVVRDELRSLTVSRKDRRIVDYMVEQLFETEMKSFREHMPQALLRAYRANRPLLTGQNLLMTHAALASLAGC